MIKTKKLGRGFTLIELMVVIAIIGILSSIMYANFSSAKSRSRDAKRVSDMTQIQLALAGYFDRCSTYPADLSIPGTACSGGPNLGNFISSIPVPPSGGNYNYVVDSAGGNDDYFLQTTLENPGSASNNSLPTPPSWYTPGLTCFSASANNFCLSPK
jgi:prepilin-type N-terminal cleavage/methylation domain-containing protein